MMVLFRKNNNTNTNNNGKSGGGIFKSVNSDLRLAASEGNAAEVIDLLKKGVKFIPNKVNS